METNEIKNEARLVVHEGMPDAEVVTKWLHICSKDGAGEHCPECPYNRDPYENGCGQLLADAGKLIRFLLG